MGEEETSTAPARKAEHLVTGTKEASGTQLPTHLSRLPGSTWALWRWVGLRGTGFPTSQILNLSAPRCSAMADRILMLEDEARLARGAASEKLSSRIDATLEHFRQMFKAETDQISQVIRKVAETERFREAIAWQNRQALRGSIDALLRMSRDTNSRRSERRKREALVANYMQRYSVKNDTIGFFGPVGWAWVMPYGEAISARPGSDLVAERTVYFEGWGIDALAEALSRDEAILPWAVPRRMPFMHLDGTTLHLPLAPALKLSTKQAAVLHICDGHRTAKEIAMELAERPDTDLRGEQEVYDILTQLCVQRRIVWSLEVPAEGAYPERGLRRLLRRIEDERIRLAALGALDEFEAARAAVAQANGNVEKLEHALGDLDATFTRLTGRDATRHAGKMYAARTLVYEDCRRAIEVELGPPILEALGPPLTLLLTSARWFTFATAAFYRRAFKEIYNKLTRKVHAPTVDFADFWLWSQPLVFGENTNAVDNILSIFQERWANILTIPHDARRVHYASADLQLRVLKAFAAPGPGWRSARHHSPDVMIAASSVEAIRQGDYQLVMGEFHLGMNTLRISAFVAQHPSPDDLLAALASDLAEPGVVPVASKQWPSPPARTLATLVSPKDFRLIFAHDTCGVPASQALPIGELIVETCESDLIVRTRDRRLRFDIIEVFAEFLTLLVVDRLKILCPSNHTPRVTFDRLVVSREAWYFSPSEIAFAHDETEADRFVAARRWTHAHGIPRFVFVKVPVEEKPIYLDFDSPISIDIFARLIRRTITNGAAGSLIRIVEMLPTSDQAWLPDAVDRRYTSELRFVAVDPEIASTGFVELS